MSVDEAGSSFGSFVRARRRTARLSLRQVADRAKISNAYLSQLERGLHMPSLAVLQALAEALGLSISTLLLHAGIRIDALLSVTTEDVIRADARLSEDQKCALVDVYLAMVTIS